MSIQIVSTKLSSHINTSTTPRAVLPRYRRAMYFKSNPITHCKRHSYAYANDLIQCRDMQRYALKSINVRPGLVALATNLVILLVVFGGAIIAAEAASLNTLLYASREAGGDLTSECL